MGTSAESSREFIYILMKTILTLWAPLLWPKLQREVSIWGNFRAGYPAAEVVHTQREGASRLDQGVRPSKLQGS